MSAVKSPLFTRKEAARYLSVSESSLDRFVARKQLRAVRMGRVVRFLKTDLDAFIEQNY